MTLIIPPYRPFELGQSEAAKEVVKNYKTFLKTNEYSFLKDCFTHLHTLEEEPGKKIIAAKATDALARVTFDRYTDIYKKCYISNSAASALGRSDLDLDYWHSQFMSLGEEIKMQGLDESRMKAAGLKKENPAEVYRRGYKYVDGRVIRPFI